MQKAGGSSTKICRSVGTAMNQGTYKNDTFIWYLLTRYHETLQDFYDNQNQNSSSHLKIIVMQHILPCKYFTTQWVTKHNGKYCQ